MQIDSNIGSMYLDKLVLFREPKIVNDMHRRSFTINTDNETVHSLEHMIHNNIGLNDLLMSNQCSNIINLTPMTSGGIIVPYGWNEDRLSFIMSVVVKESSTKTNFYFLSGYTDYYDPILNRNITSINQLDNKMKFHINNITLVSELISAMSNEPIYKFMDEITVIKNNGNTIYDNSLNDDYLLRPVDVFTNMWNFNVANNLTNEGMEVNVDNVNPISYITSIIDTIKTTMALSTGGGSEDEDLSDEAALKNKLYTMSMRAEQRETPMSNCPFLTGLYRLTYEARPSRFTLNNLIEMFGISNVDTVTKFLMYSDDASNNRLDLYRSNNIDNILTSNVLESNHAPTIENLIAMEFYYMIATVLFKKKITSAIVTCSNHRAFFTEEVGMVNNAYSHFHQIFTSITALDYVDRYIKDIILPKITKGKRLDVNVVADIDILGKSSIAVTVESGLPTVFRYNSSMDNNFTPLVTDKQNKDLVADGLLTLIDSIYYEGR